MRRNIARSVGKSGAVIKIAARIGSPRQVEVESGVQSVPLIVIQQEVAIPRGEIRQPSADRAFTLGMRVSISEINLAPMRNPRRTKSEFPPVQSRTVDG